MSAAYSSPKKFRYIYGPVYSWRLGSSLGIDPLSQKEKVCTFDCIYCQLGKTGQLCRARKIFVPTKCIIDEIAALPPATIDYVTFSGRGEPTLARNLGTLIRAVRKIRKEKIAVITNASLIDRQDVRHDLAEADFVLAKLDACFPDMLAIVNRPAKGITFARIIDGLTAFRREYKGKLALQIMFIPENKAYARCLAEIARAVKPDEVQLNTPLRPCAVMPVTKAELLNKIYCQFDTLPTRTVYDVPRHTTTKSAQSFNKRETKKRHGIAE